MRCFLAAFDQSHRADDGSYWTWRHSDIPMRALDEFYYGCAATHWPKQVIPIPVDVLRGGCTSVGDEWVCWYRFVDGGSDTLGRPGRYVLLAAFVQQADHSNRDWSGLLESQQFVQLAGQAAVTCPVPVPDDLAMQWRPMPVRQGSPAADHLRQSGQATLEAENGLEIVSAVCSNMPSGQGFDCFIVRENEALDVNLVLRESRGPRPSEEPESRIKSRPAVSPIPKLDPTRFPKQFIAAIAQRTKWARVRANQQAVLLVIAFIAGIAIGTVLGWHLHGSFSTPTSVPDRDELDLREPKLPILGRGDVDDNRASRPHPC